MDTIIERLRLRFSPTAVGDWIAAHLPNLVTAVLTFAVFYVAWFMVDRALNAIKGRIELDPTLMTFIRSVLKYTILIMGTLSALSELGINTVSIMASLGVVGLTVGFAARDTLSNIISGVFIFWDRPFVIGDLVEIGDKYGRVEVITLRSTRVVTPDGKMLAIPNSAVVNSTVASYTNFPNLRLDIDLTVGTEEDIGRIEAIFLSLVQDPRFLTEPAPAVVLKEVGDYCLTLEFRVWLQDEKAHIPERFALRRALYEALRDAEVVMPNETIQLAPFELRPPQAEAS